MKTDCIVWWARKRSIDQNCGYGLDDFGTAVENVNAPSVTGRMVGALWPVFSRPEIIARYFALASLGLLQ